MTNYDYIRTLDMKNLAKLFDEITAEDKELYIVCNNGNNCEQCKDCFEKWLRKEHDNNETYFL